MHVQEDEKDEDEDLVTHFRRYQVLGPDRRLLANC